MFLELQDSPPAVPVPWDFALLLQLWPELVAGLLLCPDGTNASSTKSSTAVRACLWRAEATSFLAASLADASDPFSPAQYHRYNQHGMRLFCNHM